jgi:Reverse transcriptase (RNA-dependent DNA polymerase).
MREYGRIKYYFEGGQSDTVPAISFIFSQREEVRKIVDDLIDNNIIRESVSPFASPIILIPKATGGVRMCVDYRGLNKITVKDRYALPLIDDQLDCLGKGQYFTTLDMASGFHQIPVAADSIAKTAFVTPDGQYEYLRMPFGLANAPAVFQRAINAALGNLRFSVAVVYLDDIIIPSRTIEEGLNHLERVLHVLDVAGFSLNVKNASSFNINRIPRA